MTDHDISPLRRRMIGDMTIRKLAVKTQHDYIAPQPGRSARPRRRGHRDPLSVRCVVETQHTKATEGGMPSALLTADSAKLNIE